MRTLLGLALALATAGITSTTARAGTGAGAVYAMTNGLDANAVVVYDRAPDGQLSLRGSFATGGRGVGATTEPVDALGSEAPLVLTADQRWLLAVNAGSDQISVFHVLPDGLELRDVVASGGQNPSSLAISGSLVYVLNSGGQGNITGFSLASTGRLVAIPGSTRTLDLDGTSPPFFLVSPAQVGFDGTGNVLIVTIKGNNEIRTFPLDYRGRPSRAPVVTRSHGSTPFGFAIGRFGLLAVAEPFGNASPGVPGSSAVSNYLVRPDGSLDLVSPSVENQQTASCWTVAAGPYLYTTNNGSDTISGYRVRRTGALRLLTPDGVVAHTGHAPVDATATADGAFLYNVNAGDGTISAFRVALDGSLIPLNTIGGLPADAGAVGIAAR